MVTGAVGSDGVLPMLTAVCVCALVIGVFGGDRGHGASAQRDLIEPLAA